MLAQLILISAVADLEVSSQKPSSIDTRPLPPLPGDSFTALQVNAAYGAISNRNLHSTAPTQYTQSVTNYNRREDEIHSDSYEYVSNHSGSAGEASLYMPLSLTTRDEGNDYMHLFPANKVKEQTDSTPSSKVDPTVSSKVDPTDSVSFKVNPTLSTDPSELTMEHFADAEPRQAQLWMLMQIQKMVQKMERMEDLYESAGYLRPPSPLLQNTTAMEQPPPPAISADNLRPPSPLPPTAEQPHPPANSANNLQPPSPQQPTAEQSQLPAISPDNLQPPSPLPPTATVIEQPHPTTEFDLEYHDASSIVQPTDTEEQQPPPATQVQEKMPTRKEIYINLGGTQKKTTYKPLLPSPSPPAIPPKTYKKISYVQVKESSGPAGSRPRQQQMQSAQKRESQTVKDYKNVPQQEMIGKTKFKQSVYTIIIYSYLQTH